MEHPWGPCQLHTPNEVPGIAPPRATILPKRVTVINFHTKNCMRPNLEIGSQTAPETALEGGLPTSGIPPLPVGHLWGSLGPLDTFLEPLGDLLVPLGRPLGAFCYPLGMPGDTLGGHAKSIPNTDPPDCPWQDENPSKTCNCLHFSHVAKCREWIQT